ncbi:hypothetical protein [Cytobacillus oceanisediminis]|uniref:Mercuric ion transport protein n=1 Tax=Cytobacillus oceanisediminis TaxID=665099 RepID=A0ABX3CJU9_9BACI|nr:hypothetical protein [Cytobacillus oceanisediminis]OHX41350.1 hypothetical protein BBV17_28550 [Cytobacillus oceanisediminis]
MKNTLKSSGWFLVALVTCPCHLFLLIPLLAGTALGSYFTEFRAVTYIILALLFVFSLYMGWRKMFPETKKDDCCCVKR